MSNDNSEDDTHARISFKSLVLGCIGVVYGDIGTSPLYAFREAAGHIMHDGDIRPAEIYGILSLIIWVLILIVTLKYVLFLLRIDNRGEGGNLALMALARKALPNRTNLLLLIGMLGASLFFGEAAITPAISVLSAVEGLKLVSPAFDTYIMSLSIVIMIALFSFQKSGTEMVSRFFGPIMLAWFSVIGLLGISWIIREPAIFNSLNPYYAINFLITHSGISLLVMGAAFLAVTGAEALYIDLGHFGRKPIQAAWLYLVFPCLILNYLGQGAMVLENPQNVENSFFLMAPDWGLVPLIILATVATIIASQAVITGMYSLTRQAVRLGFLPRLEVRHTSFKAHGQIYMPQVNRLLLCLVLLLILIFENSGNLAAAYGIAVNGTMIITSILAFAVIWKVLDKKLSIALAMIVPFLIVESAFLWANLQKFLEGGFVPVFMAILCILTMFTWLRGTRYLYDLARRNATPMGDLVGRLDREPPIRIDGTAVFLTSNPQSAPAALMQNLRHNKVLHAHNIILTVITLPYPTIRDDERFSIEPISSSFVRLNVSFGYMETPNVPRALLLAQKFGLETDISDVSYFLGRRTILSSSAHRMTAELTRSWKKTTKKPSSLSLESLKRAYQVANDGSLSNWQDHIYIALAKSAVSATNFFCLPRHKVLELGEQMEV